MSEAMTAENLLALFKETRELFRETAHRMQETDRRMQETDRQMQETDRKIKEVSLLVGNLGNRLGEFVESMVAPAIIRLFRERGIEVHQIFPNAQARRGNEHIEVDLLAVNGAELVATECKSRLSVEHVDEHIGRLGKIRRLFPQWASHTIYGAVAAMVVEDGIADYAEGKGLFLIAQSGDTVEIRNRQDFRPRKF
jgi:hypothetical protein